MIHHQWRFVAIAAASVLAVSGCSLGSDDRSAPGPAAAATGARTSVAAADLPAIHVEERVTFLETANDGVLYAVTEDNERNSTLLEIGEQDRAITRTAELGEQVRSVAVTEEAVWFTFAETIVTDEAFDITATVGAVARVNRDGATLSVIDTAAVNQAGVHAIASAGADVWLAGPSRSGGSQIVRYDPNARSAGDTVDTATERPVLEAIAARDGTGYATSGRADLAIVDLADARLDTTISLDGAPIDIATAETDTWVLTEHPDRSTVHQIAPATLVTTATYTTTDGATPYRVAATADHAYIGGGDNTVYTPTPNGTLEPAVTVAGDITDIAAGQDGLWIATNNGSLRSIVVVAWEQL